MTTVRPESKLTQNPYRQVFYFYPNNLGEQGSEPYMLFDIRDSVVQKGAPKKVIGLPLANDLKAEYSLNYSAEELTIEAAISQVGAVDSVGAALREASQKVMSMSKTLQHMTRTVYNPHLAMLFQGIGFRSFTFEFDLRARNQKESDQINNIIKAFKYHSAPGVPEDAAKEVRFFYPDEFLISVYSPAEEYLFKMSRCVLNNMSVNYSGSGQNSFFRNTGAPTDVKLMLNFTETEVMTKERIAEGY